MFLDQGYKKQMQPKDQPSVLNGAEAFNVRLKQISFRFQQYLSDDGEERGNSSSHFTVRFSFTFENLK